MAPKEKNDFIMVDVHNRGSRTYQFKDHTGELRELPGGRTLAIEKSIADKMKGNYADIISPEDLSTGTSSSDTEALRLENAQLREALTPFKEQVESLKKSLEEVTIERDSLKNDAENLSNVNKALGDEIVTLNIKIDQLSKAE